MDSRASSPYTCRPYPAGGTDPEPTIQAFKDKLGKGAPVLVVNPDHPWPSLVESLGRLLVDAVWID